MAKTKILYIITQGERGGAQRYVFDLATGFTDDCDITVAVGEQRERTDLQDRIQDTGYGIKVIQLKHLVRRISPFHDILAIFELAKLYKTLKPDIIHLNSSKAGILGSLAKLTTFTTLQLTTIIYTVHGWVFNEPLGRVKKTLYRWLEKFTSRWKDKIIVLSDFDYQTGQKAGIPTDKLVKIPLGIETPKFLDREKARQELIKLSPIPYLPSPTIIGTIANLYTTKGLDTLVEAVRLMVNMERDSSTSPPTGGFARNDSGVKFAIIGEGPERKNLEKLIKKYKLEQTVHLLGAIDNAARYLPAFDLFVLPSRKEGVPYTMLEAMVAGLPIVATNVGGVKELIDDAIIPNDPKILAEKIIQTIKKPVCSQKNIPSLEEMLKKTKNIYLLNID